MIEAHLHRESANDKLMGSLEDQIADVVLAKFETLPAKSKPTNDTDGIRNWVPLSGIVISTGI